MSRKLAALPAVMSGVGSGTGPVSAVSSLACGPNDCRALSLGHQLHGALTPGTTSWIHMDAEDFIPW